MGISSGVFKRAEYIPDRWDFKRDFQGAKEGVLGYNGKKSIVSSRFQALPKTVFLPTDSHVKWGGDGRREIIGLMPASRFQGVLFERALEACNVQDKDRVLRAYRFIKRTFGALPPRRIGESAQSHPIGVAGILMMEMGENDPDLIIEALMHDYVEDIIYKRLHTGRQSMTYAQREEHARATLRSLGFLNEGNITVIMALTVEKGRRHSRYFENILEQENQVLQARMAKIRAIDKIFNTRQGEKALANSAGEWVILSPESRRRLYKQTKSGLEWTSKIIQHGIPNPDKQRYAQSLKTASIYAVQRLETALPHIADEKEVRLAKAQITRLKNLFGEAFRTNWNYTQEVISRYRKSIARIVSRGYRTDLIPPSSPPPPSA